jgi:hypothetical protein
LRKNILAVLFLAICPLLIAQQALNNDSVIKLVNANLSDDLIVSTINASAGNYDTSAEGIIALKTAGVSDKIVAAIVAKSSAPVPAPAVTTPVQPPSPATADPDDPASTHELGIYIFNDSAPAGAKMIMLKPSFYKTNQSGSVLESMATYGIAKIKSKDMINGARANVRITDSQPTFYFYLGYYSAYASRNSQTPSIEGVLAPAEFVLRKFDIKKDTRESILTSGNMYTSTTTSDNGNFITTMLRPGAFKVTLNAPLSPGEYGFVLNRGVVLDFGKD